MKKRMKWLIPLSAVAIVAVVAAVALILHLSAPDPIVYEPGTVIYQDDQVTAKVVEPAAERNIVRGYFSSPSAEDTFVGHPIIATGTVYNIREVELSYVDSSRPTTRVVTLFDFHVSEYVTNTSQTISNKGVLTVGWPFSSGYFAEEAPALHEGAEFLLFMHVMAELDYDDIVNRKAFTDTWVTGANFLAFEKANGKYTLNTYFEKYLTDTEKNRATTDLVNIIKEKVAQYQGVE